MAQELFIEIGTEEIPAGFLPKAMADLQRLLSKELSSANIGCGEIRTFATPRRIAIVVNDVVVEQQRQELSLTGPSVKVAYDADGNPTKAAIGFAKSNGVEVGELTTVETEKGTYIQIAKVIEGRPTRELLPEMLPKVIAALPFKKSMRWKDLDIRFARPMHWIVALFGGEVVPFEFGNLTSGKLSRGHRFMAPDQFEVADCSQWLTELERRFVTADPQARRDAIEQGVVAIAAEAGGAVNLDQNLLDEITYLVEDPTPVCGGFEAEFLQLPRELLVTSMKTHQRYFTVSDKNGKLLPNFITVSNTRAEDLKVVANGNERVLRARLSDAMFFWKEDQKSKLESRLEALKNVVYQQKLGTSYEKVMRFTAIAKGLAERFEPAAVASAERAAMLAKCDLETNMVYEFPELQGIMGREYLTIEGEDSRIATAVFEHYLPIEAGGDLPSDNLGAFVSIADKIDTICGCFGVGLIPSGSADPYALRRSAIGILNIILDRDFRLSLVDLIGQSVELLAEKLVRPADEVRADVLNFFRGRFQNMLTGQGVPNDVVDAALAAAFDDPVDARLRAHALAELKGREDFEPLSVAFKRVGNIIKGGTEVEVDPELFEADAEKKLFSEMLQVRKEVDELIAADDYAAAMRAVAGLRPAIDAFFEDVMVMAEDPAVKTNRLALLTDIAGLFQGIADFARIA